MDILWTQAEEVTTSARSEKAVCTLPPTKFVLEYVKPVWKKKTKTNLDLLAWQDIKTCGHSTCKWNRFKARIHTFWTNLQSQSCFVLNMLKIITIPNCTLNYIAEIYTAVTLWIITTKMKQECWSMYKTLHLRSYFLLSVSNSHGIFILSQLTLKIKRHFKENSVAHFNVMKISYYTTYPYETMYKARASLHWENNTRKLWGRGKSVRWANADWELV